MKTRRTYRLPLETWLVDANAGAVEDRLLDDQPMTPKASPRTSWAAIVDAGGMNGACCHRIVAGSKKQRQAVLGHTRRDDALILGKQQIESLPTFFNHFRRDVKPISINK